MSGTERYNRMSEAVALNEMTGIEVLNLFVEYLGQQILTDRFLEHVMEEGYKIDLKEIQ